MSFAQTLADLMEQENLSAYRLSKETGLSDSLINFYRNGERDPSGGSLIKLADYFNVSVDYLLGRTDKPEVNK